MKLKKRTFSRRQGGGGAVRRARTPYSLAHHALSRANEVGRAEEVEIRFDPAWINSIIEQGIAGFAPVIINITPLPSVLPLLGLAPNKEEEEFEVSQLN